MNWKPRIAWALLSLLVALTAWELTRWVTRVDRNGGSEMRAVYDASPGRQLSLAGLSLNELRQNRYRIPAIVVSGFQEALFVVTPATRSLVLGVDPATMSCGFITRAFTGASAAAMASAARHATLQRLALTPAAPDRTLVRVPSSLHELLAHTSRSQGAIVCTFLRPLAGATTFTERAMTIEVRGLTGVFMLDVSALEDLDDLRFSGGVAFPLAGDRTRFLDATDNIVSVEWTDVASEERRDIVLVVAGAFFAIAAATAIEAIRPFIER